MSQSACMIELQRLGEKLQHAYQRRDHYAQLYYKVAAKLEDTERELLEARKEIQALKSQGNFVCKVHWLKWHIGHSVICR